MSTITSESYPAIEQMHLARELIYSENALQAGERRDTEYGLWEVADRTENTIELLQAPPLAAARKRIRISDQDEVMAEYSYEIEDQGKKIDIFEEGFIFDSRDARQLVIPRREYLAISTPRGILREYHNFTTHEIRQNGTEANPERLQVFAHWLTALTMAQPEPKRRSGLLRRVA